MGDIIKTASFEQRVAALDGSGTLSCFAFDSKITGNCVFNMKKAGVVDFCMMKPTIFGLCTGNSIQVIDTLLHPKRQSVFRLQMAQSPLGVQNYRETKLAVARKNDLLVYDIRMDMQEYGRDYNGGKFRCMETNHDDKLFIGRADNNRLKIVDCATPDNDLDIRLSKGSVGNYFCMLRG